MEKGVIFALSSTSREGKGLNVMNRNRYDFTGNEQVTWSVYYSYPKHSRLDLDIEVAGPNSYFSIFPSVIPETVLNVQQVSRKCIFIRLFLNVFQLKSK